ncbi:hypothetical protein G6F23_015992 [Rhizopus arrhizus]|nr:hypothetical protein G6F23_015992 [Rhizopus arrhizus]
MVTGAQTGALPIWTDRGVHPTAPPARPRPRSSASPPALPQPWPAMQSPAAPASSAGSSRARNAPGRPDRSSVSGRDRPAARSDERRVG